jgi:hypothetical protein
MKAPHSLHMGPAPAAAPILKEISSMIREELEPTAARASLPRKFPTTIESTVLYNC